MSRSPLISVVTPFLNAGAHLGEAIESVLAQSFGDWELILVDDGSDDDGPEIARAYAGRHPDRISVLEHPGRACLGSSVSRNAGGEAARGEWLAYLDSDDVWRPGKLAEQVAIVRAHPEVGLVLGATLYWRSWDGSDPSRDEVVQVGSRQGVDPGCVTPLDTVIQPPRLLSLIYPLRLGAAAPSVNTVLVRAAIVREVGGWESRFRTAYDDQAFLVKLYLETPAYVSSAWWDKYRQRPDSIMARELGPGDYDRHRRNFLEWFEGYLGARGLEGTEYWHDLQQALRPYRHPVSFRTSRLVRRAMDAIRGLGKGA